MIKDPERISVKTVAGHHRLQAGTRQVNKGEGERQNIQLTGSFRSKGFFISFHFLAIGWGPLLTDGASFPSQVGHDHSTTLG